VVRESFQQELDQLVESVLSLGKEVEGALNRMVEVMESSDLGDAAGEVGSDSRYKARGMQIDEEGMILQARQAPVARDLRLLYTLHGVTEDIVRVGTLCEHIFHSMAETADQEYNEDLFATLVEMARSSRNIFSRGLEIFRTHDIEKAQDLQAADDKVDLLYSEAMNLAISSSEGDASPEWRMRAALMVHYLERIADRGVNVGARTVFLVSGERMENAMWQYLNRNLRSEEEE
jgi:phosphate transport system protein